MSSSCHSVTRLALAAGAVCSLGAIATAHAAQTFVQPQVEVRAETNSNLGLNPDGSEDGTTEGYIANLQVLIGYETPRGETSIRPRVRFQHYPSDDRREKAEGFLNWVTRYEWQRSRFDLNASYSQQDSYNYDTRSGEFDPLDPNYGNAAGSGKSLVGETQTEAEFRPSYSYDVTERLSVSVGADYQTTNYDADEGPADQIDYDYWSANANLRWALDERSNVGFGGYFSQYSPASGDGDSDGYGVGVSYGHRWSEVLGFEATLGYQVDDPKYPEPGQGDQKSSSVGGSIAAFGEGEVSKWQFFASQRYAPDGDGRVRQIDQVRFQYDHKFTQRLTLRGTARYESQEQTSGANGGSEDKARLDMSLRWQIRPKWFLHGGYAYIWQQEGSEDDAYNNRFYIGAGYRGLGKER